MKTSSRSQNTVQDLMGYEYKRNYLLSAVSGESCGSSWFICCHGSSSSSSHSINKSVSSILLQRIESWSVTKIYYHEYYWSQFGCDTIVIFKLYYNALLENVSNNNYVVYGATTYILNHLTKIKVYKGLRMSTFWETCIDILDFYL